MTIVTSISTCCVAVVLLACQPTVWAAEVETLHGVQFGVGVTTIEVESSGCTGEEDFKFVVRKRRQHVELTAIRVEPDYCKAFSHLVSLSFKNAAIGLPDGVPVQVQNSFTGFPRY